ncbi:hypothetical protein ACFO9Q_13260 [Paenibacillus sp. GCM10023252]
MSNIGNEEIDVKINGHILNLRVGVDYYFSFKDPDVSFHSLRAKVMNIYWKDNDSEATYFFILVHDHNEDYLICDNELISAKLADVEH